MTTITEGLPRTGLVMPNDAELGRLREIVAASHPTWQTSEGEFRRAFWAAGQFYRTVQPWSGQYFSFWTGRANELLTREGFAEIEGGSLLCAIVAHGDICWRAADRWRGQLLEVGLSQYSGQPCRNVWRRILSGEATLLAPTPSDRPEQPLHIVRSNSPD